MSRGLHFYKYIGWEQKFSFYILRSLIATMIVGMVFSGLPHSFDGFLFVLNSLNVARKSLFWTRSGNVVRKSVKKQKLSNTTSTS